MKSLLVQRDVTNPSAGSDDTVYATMHVVQDATTWEEIGWAKLQATGPVIFTCCVFGVPILHDNFNLLPGMQLTFMITRVDGQPDQIRSLLWWDNSWWILEQRSMGAATQTDVVLEMISEDDATDPVVPITYVRAASLEICTPGCVFNNWTATFTDFFAIDAPYHAVRENPDVRWYGWGP